MGSQYSAQAQTKAPKPETNSDEEDLNLLGYSRRQSISAVSIGKPGTSRPKYKPYTGGPRPMNSLTTSRNLPDQTYSTMTKPPVGKQKALAVGITRGFNVTCNTEGGKAEDSFDAPPSAKRQKLKHAPSPVASESSDSIDEAGPAGVSFGRRLSGNQATSSPGQRFDKKAPNLGSIGGSKEYSSVQRMMDSNPRNVRRKYEAAARKSSSPLLDALSRNNSVEMVGKHDGTAAATTPCQSYEDTTQKQPETTLTNGSNHARGKAHELHTRSRYIEKEPRLPVRSPESEQHRLSTQFRGTDGKLRGTYADNLSSDELDGPAIHGEHADVLPLSPGKRHQHVGSKSSISVIKSPKSPVEEQSMERSNIKPTVFRARPPSKGRQSRVKDFEQAFSGEEEPSWAISVAAVNIAGQKSMHESSNMDLVFDETNNSYFIKDGGEPLRSKGSRFEILPRSLQKCFLEHSGRRIRFESSKRGIEDNLLELVMTSARDAVKLVNKIQEKATNVSVINITSERILKMFEMRRNQSRPAPRPIQGLDQMDEDVQLAARNRQRQEAKDQEVQETANTKRRRTTKLTDELAGGTAFKDTPAGFIRNRVLNTEPNGFPKCTTGTGASTRSSFFDQPAHNGHLVRRSTRSSGVPARYLEANLPEEPKIEKHSVKFGLGNKWSKPLSYPKTGKKKATVEWEDLERLDEGEFLNDNLVSFYLRYLEEELTNNDPELAKTVYFFNSFFYDRLTTTPKGQKGINYDGVQRWTRGVSLFSYDYVVVPINELTHWYVAIICNLPGLDRKVALSEEPSSPMDAAGGQLAQELENPPAAEEAPEPEEREARQSFAEMSLDGKKAKRQLSEDSLIGEVGDEGVAVIKAEDDEMLDAPDVTLQESQPGEDDDSKSLKQEEGADNTIEDLEEVPKSSTLTKKQKRKYMSPSITKINPSRPTIITFDSFGHPHPAVTRVLKTYLHEEGKAKRNTEFDVSQIKGITAHSIPQQSNFSDCGLFMLGYVEKFLADSPRDFIAKIIKREYDVQKDWPKMVPSDMRRSLREQLQKLHEEEQDERRANAVKAGKYSPGSRLGKDKSPTVATGIGKPKSEAATESASETIDDGSSKITLKSTLKEARPIDVKSIRNLDYSPPEVAEEDRSKRLPLPKQLTEDEVTLDPSIVVVGSQTQPQVEIASKEEQPDVPSSQPPRSQTLAQNMPGSFPTLPSEIEDSQPSQLQEAELQGPANLLKRTSDEKTPEDLALSPEPRPQPRAKPLPTGKQKRDPLETEQRQIARHSCVTPQTEKLRTEQPDRKFTNWRPTGTEEAHVSPPPLPRRKPKRGIAQKEQSKLKEVVKKMTKEEAIVLDDD